MPSRGQLRLLVVVGAIAGVGTLVCGVLLAPILGPALGWPLPFVAAYVVGVVACRSQPENLAARRLLVFGTVALSWLSLSELFLLMVDAVGLRPWFTVGNTVTQMAGLLMSTALAAMLVVYPDGVLNTMLQRRVTAVLVSLSLTLPVVLLVSRERVHPSLIIQWATGEGEFAVTTPASPLYVEHLSWLGGVASFAMESALGLVPAIGVLVLALRYRSLDHAQRERVAWPLLCGLLVVLLSVADLLVAYESTTRVVMDIAAAACLVLLPVSLGKVVSTVR